MDRWNGFQPLSFTLEPDEARVSTPADLLPGPFRVIFGVLGGLYLILGAVRLVYDRGNALAIFNFVLACFYIGYASIYPRLVARRRYAKPGSYTLRFSADGIAVDAPKPAQIRWHDVTQVQDLGEALLITSRRHAALVVPKRIFDDRGAALWARLEQQLIGGYQLRRRPGSSVIVNTAYA